MKKKPLKYAVQYANGGIFEVGEVTNKMRRSMKIPFCDTVYLRLKHAHSKRDDIYSALTYDEMAAIGYLCTLLSWQKMPRAKRYYKRRK
jgi:hypothetical protein